MNKIKAIIFDMDGVLIDSETICDRTWAITAKEMGVGHSDEVIAQCRGTNATDTAAILRRFYGDDFDLDHFLKRTSQLFHEIEDTQGIPPMPYVKEALEFFKGKYRLAVASSARKESVLRELKNIGIVHFFETFTCGDMVEHSKPNPEIYLKACESLGLKPEECVAVEDSPNGVKSAVAAGIKTVMVPDSVQPDEELCALAWKICPSLKEMCEIL